MSPLLGLLRIAVIDIVVIVLWEVDSIALFGPVVAVLLVVWAPPPLLLVVGLGLVLVLFGGFLGHPCWELGLVFLVPLFGLFVLALLAIAPALVVVVVGLPLFLKLPEASRAIIFCSSGKEHSMSQLDEGSCTCCSHES